MQQSGSVQAHRRQGDEAEVAFGEGKSFLFQFTAWIPLVFDGVTAQPTVAMMSNSVLQVSEIYNAICGESRHSGWPCTLVRLTGCHLRCRWCDTAYAFSGGQAREISSLMAEIRETGLPTVLVTGGEPLLQRPVVDLMAELLADGRRVLLETSGTRLGGGVALDEVPAGVRRIVDIKTPGSGIAPELIDWPGIVGLGADDEIKIVCADRQDYLWARDLVRAGDRWPRATTVSFSPVCGELEPRRLAEWILTDRLDVRFQVQLHRLVWPEVDRGV